MKLNEETSDFVYLGKRIDKALDYIQNDKTNLLNWFNNYVEFPYQDIMSGELEIEEEDYIFDYLDSLLDDLEEKFNTIFEIKQPKMTNETLRMQMLAGVITEGEYTAIINKEIEEEEKSSLNESMIGGIVGIGAINQIPPREKTDYETAFEHFLGERYQVKPNRERDDIKDINEEEVEEGALMNEEYIVSIRTDYGTISDIEVSAENEEEAFDKAIDKVIDALQYAKLDQIEKRSMEEGKEVEEPNNY
jgi:hypothetical protein